jgi:hypothetical protein
MVNNLVYGVPVRKEKREGRVGARVTKRCRGIINAIMQRYNFSEGDVMELVFREYAENHKIEPVYWDAPKIDEP